MILELDVGNSRIKWRLLDTQSGSVTELAFASSIEELFDAMSSIESPQMIRMCSVRGGETDIAIKQWVNDKWAMPVQVARVSQACGGVRHQYEDQTRLGIDRWLAMLSAYRLAQGACIVIDSGTALTIDVLDENGLHQGGYIVPGLQLMRKSLEQNTRIRLTERSIPEALDLGNATESAVRNGTLAAQVNLIDAVVQSRLEIDVDTRIFFAGGDAELLASQSIVETFQVTPSLVLDGLAIACPFP